MKTMKMNEKIIANRAGIYAQKSTEVTAVGDGLTSKEVKSPVMQTKYLKRNNLSEKYTEKEEKQQEQEQKQEEQDPNMSRGSDVEIVEGNQINFACDPAHDMFKEQTELKVFPDCEKFYGKERWDKALQTLQKLGYVNWEINAMFRALDEYPKFGSRKSIEKEPDPKYMNKKPRLDGETNEKADVISGILLNECTDLRANIGDASHPNFHILPENRTKVYLEFCKLLRQEECFQDDAVLCSYFVNQTLMIECRSLEILDQIDEKISKLDHLWPGADFTLMRRSSERKSIRIYIPYAYSDVAEILEIIKKQNGLPVEEWKVNSSEKWQDGICLDVEVDGGTYLRLIQDQDDIFFLMKKATIKLPDNGESLKDNKEYH